MQIYQHILGSAETPENAALLHRLDHRHAVDRLILPRSDLARRRLRTRTEAGHEVAVALSREERLFDGALLALSEESALIVKVEAEAWLRLRPRDNTAALKLGYHAGNLHWRVRFAGGELLIAIETELSRYRGRLTEMTAAGEIEDLGIGEEGGS
ncbi:MAG: urease accessory protein UreE [Pseudomonadota bacterium]